MKKISLLLALLLCVGLNAKVRIADPRTEMLTNPVGIDCTQPRLSWKYETGKNDLKQQDYRILAATSKELLKPGKADLWDTGVVSGEAQNNIEYSGKPLASRQKVWWKVIATTNQGKTVMKPQTFQVSFLSPSDWKASWIGAGTVEADDLVSETRVPARYLTKDFTNEKKVSKATLYICGLGLYEALINGEKVGESCMVPGPTDYNKRVLYNTYDVTGMLSKGPQNATVILGNGRFVSMRMQFLPRYGIPQIAHYGMPCLLYQLEIEYADGSTQTIASDESWMVSTTGPVGCNNEFDGEEYSLFRKQNLSNPSNWQDAKVVEGPKGRLTAMSNPGIAVQESVKPVSITEQSPGVYILDMGQNMVGHLKVRLKGDEGDTLKLRFAENVKEDGSLYMDNLRSAKVTDKIVLAGARKESFDWEPLFVYHGFRFVELTGFAEKPDLSMFEGMVKYDRMDMSGTFETSNEVVNQVYRNAVWGLKGNYRGMPTDCPQRDERMGWLGDRSMGCYGEGYIFDCHLFYDKWMNDIEDGQLPDGQLPSVAPPYWPFYVDDVTWPSSFIYGNQMLYSQFADTRVIQRHYPAMKKYMLHVYESCTLNGIVFKDNYGDWCVPPESPELIHSQDPARKTDGMLLATSFFYNLAGLMENFASVTGNEADIELWKEIRAAVLAAFNDTFLDKENGWYSNNTVTANLLPYRFGMVPKEYEHQVIDNIIRKTEVDCDGHVSTGLVGMEQLMRGLTDAGRGDLAFRIASNDTYPSWGYMAKKGATTIWELWNGDTADPAMNSGNHLMLLGDLLNWFYSYLGGIGQTEESIGFKHIRLQPRAVEGLDRVDSSYDSIYGTIVSNWEKKGGKFIWHFEIPAGTTAEVIVPGSDNAVEYASGRYDITADLNQ